MQCHSEAQKKMTVSGWIATKLKLRKNGVRSAHLLRVFTHVWSERKEKGSVCNRHEIGKIKKIDDRRIDKVCIRQSQLSL